MLERLSLRHGELFNPDVSRLLPAAYHFNPSLIVWGDAVWMVYRCVTPQSGVSLFGWPRTFAVCRVGLDLQPEQGSNVDISARIESADHRRWQADPRFFMRKDGPWISYHDDRDLYSFRLIPDKLAERFWPRRLVLIDIPRRSGERNWGFFDDGVFKAVYWIHPHIVLQLDELGDEIRAHTFAQTDIAIPWNRKRWGDPHGGSSPVRVGSCWFSFFHSNSLISRWSKKKVYRLGFYGFDAEPPHRIRFMSRQPILEADHIDGPRSFYCGHAVVFPSGALYDEGLWLVSLGIHDRALAFAVFEHKRLLENCDSF